MLIKEKGVRRYFVLVAAIDWAHEIVLQELGKFHSISLLFVIQFTCNKGAWREAPANKSAEEAIQDKEPLLSFISVTVFPIPRRIFFRFPWKNFLPGNFLIGLTTLPTCCPWLQACLSNMDNCIKKGEVLNGRFGGLNRNVRFSA